MLKISDETDLLQRASSYDKLYLYGQKRLVLTCLRFLKQHNLICRVQGISFSNAQNPPHPKISNYFNIPQMALEQFSSEPSYQIFIIEQALTPKMPVEECIDLDTLSKQIPQMLLPHSILIDYALSCRLSQKEHIKLDFLCAGFTKCGTTTLHRTLKKHPSIFLPAGKETLYANWRHKYEDSPQRLKDLYFSSIPPEQKIGDIEPTYFKRARMVYECFGPDVKLVFMLRNPVHATYSYFKMMIRRTLSDQQINYYRKYHRYCPAMFTDYLNDMIYSNKDTRFQYAKWIQEYLKFFPIEQMKFVFLEDLIHNPDQILTEIQEFIGLDSIHHYQISKVNQGNLVSRNYYCARINRKLLFLLRKLKQKRVSRHTLRLFYTFRKLIRTVTYVKNNDTLSDTHRLELSNFYQPSIIHLEHLIGRNLQDICH